MRFFQRLIEKSWSVTIGDYGDFLPSSIGTHENRDRVLNRVQFARLTGYSALKLSHSIASAYRCCRIECMTNGCVSRELLVLVLCYCRTYACCSASKMRKKEGGGGGSRKNRGPCVAGVHLVVLLVCLKQSPHPSSNTFITFCGCSSIHFHFSHVDNSNHHLFLLPVPGGNMYCKNLGGFLHMIAWWTTNWTFE
jgi:hypothetical protein